MAIATIPSIEITVHAHERMQERKVPENLVLRLVRRFAGLVSDEEQQFRTKDLVVVARMTREGKCRVITVWNRDEVQKKPAKSRGPRRTFW